MVLSFKDFCRAEGQGNLITLSRQINADLDTPVSAFLKISEDPHCFLLESMEGGERWGRYSFLGSEPLFILQSEGDQWHIRSRAHEFRKIDESGSGNPLLKLKQEMQKFKIVADSQLPKLCGGAVGYLSYDMIRHFEKLPEICPASPLIFPESYFGIYDRLIIFDNLKHSAFLTINAFIDGRRSRKKIYEEALGEMDRLAASFKKDIRRFLKTSLGSKSTLHWKTGMSEKAYTQAVLKAKEYIKSGDIFQMVLSCQWQARARMNPLALYRALRELNPSPYLFCLRMGKRTLVGSSPEVMVRLEGRKATLRPIAGTRPRKPERESDLAMEKEMSEDPKERAEHIMLVDLGRNDLGRVCTPGSLQVTDLMKVERYSHVMHLVSNVEGELAEGRDAFDLLQASFPAGTLSGAPKIRAMEIIEEFEPVRRGPYGGAVGYIDFSGNMDMAITIRSIALDAHTHTVWVQAGAGIVYDSIPEHEYRECQNKAKAMMEAVKKVVK